MNGMRPDPSDPHKVVTQDVDGHKFTAGFYPGFASSIAVNGVSLYNQKGEGGIHPFVLPAGSDRPFSTSAVDLTSSKGHRVTIHLDDPDHVIDHVEVVLRDPRAGVAAMSADGGAGGGDTVTIDNQPVLCPPMC